jgi:trimethylamine--corrinoid protein Co-methyltransferase
MARRSRSGGRAGNARRTTTAAIDQMPWRNIKNIDRPTEPLDEDGVQAIHKGAMHILSKIGSRC